MNYNVSALFFQAAQQYPDNIAIMDSKETISYQDLAVSVQRCIYKLEKAGIKKGDKVLVFIPMSVALYSNVLAIFSLGAIAVFVDDWASIQRLRQCCERVELSAMIAPRWILLLSRCIPGLARITHRIIPHTSVQKTGEAIGLHTDESALITFTTGSTGIPKAADRTHLFLRTQFEILRDKINQGPGDISMVTLPIVLLCNLATGASSIIPSFSSKKPEKTDFESIKKQLKQQAVDTLLCSPAFVIRVADQCLETMSYPRRIITGGAPVFPSQAKHIKGTFPAASLDIVYGSTEAEPISMISAEELEKEKDRIAHLGLPVGTIDPKTQLKVVQIIDGIIKAEHLDDLSCDEGELGEIIVAGDHVLKRYYNSPKAFSENKIQTKDTIWHRTGDSGRRIGNRLYLTGRCQQIFEWEGKQYSPFILENVLQEYKEIEMGTFIILDDSLYCVLELNDKDQEIPPSISSIVPGAQILSVSKIPRDPRHHSKIDYDALNKAIKARKNL